MLSLPLSCLPIPFNSSSPVRNLRFISPTGTGTHLARSISDDDYPLHMHDVGLCIAAALEHHASHSAAGCDLSHFNNHDTMVALRLYSCGRLHQITIISAFPVRILLSEGSSKVGVFKFGKASWDHFLLPRPSRSQHVIQRRPPLR